MATPPVMAQHQQISTNCICGEPVIFNGWCLECQTSFFPPNGQMEARNMTPLDSTGQMQAGTESSQSFPQNPANLGAQFHPNNLAASEWARMMEEVEMLERTREALRLKEEDLKRRHHMLMGSSQQHVAPRAHTPIPRPAQPRATRIVTPTGPKSYRPAAYADTNMTPNLVTTRHEAVQRSMHSMNYVHRLPGTFEAEHQSSPMTRTDSFSPLQNYATPRQSPQVRQQQQMEHQKAFRRAMVGVPPQMKISGNQLLQQNGISVTRMHHTQGHDILQDTKRSRRESAGSLSDAHEVVYTSRHGNVDNHLDTSSPPVFDTPPRNNAAPLNAAAPARVHFQAGSIAQLKAVHAQLAHERAAQTQRGREPSIDSAIRPSQKAGNDRLHCPDCDSNKPVVKKRNDGIHCTACFNKRNKAGEDLQTVEQRGATPQIQKITPVVGASPSPSTVLVAHESQISTPMRSVQSAKVLPYELDYSRRRAAHTLAQPQPQSPGSQLQRAAISQQMSTMQWGSQTASYTSSPLATSQYQVSQATAIPNLYAQQTSVKARPGTPKRGHGAAFGAIGLGIKNSPVSEPSPSQNRKRAKPNPNERRNTTTITLSRVHGLTRDATNEDATSSAIFPQLDGVHDQTPALIQHGEAEAFLSFEQLITPEPVAEADVEHLKMSNSSVGHKRPLEEIEAELMIRLPIAIKQLSKQNSGIGEQRAE